MFKPMPFMCLFFFIFGFTLQGFAKNIPHFQAAIVNASLHHSYAPKSPLTIIQGTSVKMVLYTNHKGYKLSDVSLGKNIWATVSPELKQACSQYVQSHPRPISHQQLGLWIAQLLGLPAKDASKRYFVEIELPVIQAYYGPTPSMIGIFRPCTDPRIGLHAEGPTPICPKQMNSDDANISSDYKTWFINNSISAHSLDNGAPWTEYGYTYNWDKHAISTFGLSEFIVLKGTPIVILPNPNDPSTPYIAPEEYCNN